MRPRLRRIRSRREILDYERADRIIEVFESGMTFRQVAEVYGVTGERIRQIVNQQRKRRGIPRDPRDRGGARPSRLPSWRGSGALG